MNYTHNVSGKVSGSMLVLQQRSIQHDQPNWKILVLQEVFMMPPFMGFTSHLPAEQSELNMHRQGLKEEIFATHLLMLISFNNGNHAPNTPADPSSTQRHPIHIYIYLYIF